MLQKDPACLHVAFEGRYHQRGPTSLCMSEHRTPLVAATSRMALAAVVPVAQAIWPSARPCREPTAVSSLCSMPPKAVAPLYTAAADTISCKLGEKPDSRKFWPRRQRHGRER